MTRRRNPGYLPLPAIGFTGRDSEGDPRPERQLDAPSSSRGYHPLAGLDSSDRRSPLRPALGVRQERPHCLHRCVYRSTDDESSVPVDSLDTDHTTGYGREDGIRSAETAITTAAVTDGMQVRSDVSTHAIDWSYGPYVEPISVHVVDGDGATVLVGGGDDSIAEELCALGREHDIDVVLIEHAHIDHYGGVPALRAELDVTVAIPAGDAQALRSKGIDPDVTLSDGEVRWGIEAIATPGHTSGNMAFRYDDCVLAGDTVAGSDSVFAAADDWQGPLGVIEPRFNADDAQTRKSVRRLTDYDFQSVLVSHGSHVLDDAIDAVQRLWDDLQDT